MGYHEDGTNDEQISIYKEALEELNHCKDAGNIVFEIPKDETVVNAIIKVVQKQIPMKPLMEPWAPARCPLCGAILSEHVGDGYYKHYYGVTVCECGQQLKWE